MSVYTMVDEGELDRFLAEYDCGDLVSYSGISAGIENTNYFVETGSGHYVLTLFEQLLPREIPFFLELTAYLSANGVPAACPERNHSGRFLSSLKGKPAALVERLDGGSVESPNSAQCAALGDALARLHIAGESFARHRHRVNDRGPRWWRLVAGRLAEVVDGESCRQIEGEIAYQSQHHFDSLPRGVIHADLFRDNALFVGDRLSGIIDFYYACNSLQLYDLAVVVNDWCNLDSSPAINRALLTALVGAYHQRRPAARGEQDAWPVMLRAAALRFWLSRLQDLHFPRPGEITHTKDPEVFRAILIDRIENQQEYRDFW
jgi:homoserine kinase type II